MCRWIAYTGKPVFIEQIVTLPKHSLVEQSRNTKMNFDTDGTLLNVNGDGFGLGWYGRREEPGLYRDERPAWSSRNLQSLCAQIEAHLFFAHVRASTTGGVQQTNCHPFKYKNWMFQHNGYVSAFETLRQELQAEIAPALFRHIQGSTDSETFFFLALTYGLQDDPKAALQKMVRRVQQAAAAHKTAGELDLSVAISDGQSLYTLRYAENEEASTQFYADDMEWIAHKAEILEPPRQGVVVVSEPLSQLDDHWHPVPENAFTIIREGRAESERFM